MYRNVGKRKGDVHDMCRDKKHISAKVGPSLIGTRRPCKKKKKILLILLDIKEKWKGAASSALVNC